MIKKKGGLIVCKICSRPMLLYKFDVKMDFNSRVEHQGPTTHKSVKEWCRGDCFNIILPLILCLDDMHDIKLKTVEGRRLNKWWLRQCRKAIKEIENTIKKYPLKGIAANEKDEDD
jgi:hypothetical protein